jgi:hypothetical protein
MIAALQDLENQLVAFISVLSEQGLDVFRCRRLERLETVPVVYAADDADDIFAPPYVFRQEIAHAARGLCTHGM